MMPLSLDVKLGCKSLISAFRIVAVQRTTEGDEDLRSLIGKNLINHFVDIPFQCH